MFFCDGGVSAGMGHITRCCALAESFGGEALFLINGDVAVNGFAYKNITPIDWPKLAFGAVCVVDSYLADDEVISGIYRNAKLCLWIDDENLRSYPGGILVNPSLYAKTLNYSDAGLTYLLGPDYVILRKAFRQRFNKSIRTSLLKLTVIMGGTDASGMIPIITKELSGIDAELNVIGGIMLSAEQIRDVFLSSDLVISAGGQTVNELIQLRTPAILIEAAKNQRRNIDTAVEKNLAIKYRHGTRLIDYVQAMDYSTRLKLSRNMEAFDFSNGVENILKAILIRQ